MRRRRCWRATSKTRTTATTRCRVGCAGPAKYRAPGPTLAQSANRGRFRGLACAEGLRHPREVARLKEPSALRLPVYLRSARAPRLVWITRLIVRAARRLTDQREGRLQDDRRLRQRRRTQEGRQPLQRNRPLTQPRVVIAMAAKRPA